MNAVVSWFRSAGISPLAETKQSISTMEVIDTDRPYTMGCRLQTRNLIRGTTSRTSAMRLRVCGPQIDTGLTG